MHEETPQMPPATFEFLVFSLRTQAEMSLGLYLEEDGQPREPDFELAKHSIDLLGVIQEKTKGNLTPEEQDMLDNSLAELRYCFVQALQEPQEPQKQDDRPRIIIP